MSAPGLRSRSGIALGFLEETERQDTKRQAGVDRTRRRKFEDSSEARKQGDFGIRTSQNERAAERHTVTQEGLQLQNEGTSARNKDLLGEYDLNKAKRNAAAGLVGIQAEADRSTAETRINDNEGKERLRGIKEASDRSDASDNIHSNKYRKKQREFDHQVHKSSQTAVLAQNELNKRLSSYKQGQLPAKFDADMQDLMLGEIENVYKFAEIDPELAADLINNSELFDIDGATSVKLDSDGKYRAYMEDGSVAVNQRLNNGQGGPAEWDKADVEDKLKSAKSGSRSGGSSKEGVGIKKAKAVSEKEFKREVSYIMDDYPDADEAEVTEAMSYIRAHPSMNGVSYADVIQTAENRNISPIEVAKLLSRRYDNK